MEDERIIPIALLRTHRRMICHLPNIHHTLVQAFEVGSQSETSVGHIRSFSLYSIDHVLNLVCRKASDSLGCASNSGAAKEGIEQIVLFLEDI